MNPDQIKSGLTHAAGIGLAWAAGRYHLSSDQVGAMMSDVGYVGSALAFAAGIYQHFGQKKVPDSAVAIQPAASRDAAAPVGATVTGKVVGCIALLILASGLLSLDGGTTLAYAQTKPRLPIPLPIPLPGTQPSSSSGTDPLAAALLKPFQAIADFIAGDNAAAITLSTAVPELQDGHGQQCWMAAKTFSDVIKAHPIPLTLKLQTDIEAFRLLGMATNQLCANVHCTQVFADLESTAQAAGPINIGAPLPTLHDLCSKVPQISVVAPVVVPAAAPAP